MKTEKYRKRLTEDKEKLESELPSVGRKNAAVPGDWELSPSEIGIESDLADQADVVTGLETNAAILADLEARYDTILAALKRIDEGTYGVCEVCGKKVEEARLDANPAATTCIEHK